MSIVNAKRTINKLQKTSSDLKTKYAGDRFIEEELKKFNQQLQHLEDYLDNLDKLKPDYNTSEIDTLMQAAMLHVDLLREKLDKNDFAHLYRQIRLLKTIFKFHPTKYSTLAFVRAWFYEWLYFI